MFSKCPATDLHSRLTPTVLCIQDPSELGQSSTFREILSLIPGFHKLLALFSKYPLPVPRSPARYGGELRPLRSDLLFSCRHVCNPSVPATTPSLNTTSIGSVNGCPCGVQNSWITKALSLESFVYGGGMVFVIQPSHILQIILKSLTTPNML
jgi:hypothetical protein